MQCTNQFLLQVLISIIVLGLPPLSLNRAASQETNHLQKTNDKTVRFASFNISFYRSEAGQLKRELSDGNSKNPKKIAEIIQRIRPDVILLNEFDYDAAGKGIDLSLIHI